MRAARRGVMNLAGRFNAGVALPPVFAPRQRRLNPSAVAEATSRRSYTPDPALQSRTELMTPRRVELRMRFI
jgi:hypothetical protein